MEIRNEILGKIGDILKEGNVEFYEISSDLKIKVLDLIVKRKMKELEEEFRHGKEKKRFSTLQNQSCEWKENKDEEEKEWIIELLRLCQMHEKEI
jgi:hypothetical protein